LSENAQLTGFSEQLSTKMNMIRMIITMGLALLVVIGAGIPASNILAADKAFLEIVYTGGVTGHLEPCG
jgi:hypothetical protein